MKDRFVPILAVLVFITTGTSAQATDPAENRDNPTGNTGALKPQIQTGGSYDAHSGNGTRVVTDLRVPGALGEYGLNFTRYWNSTHNDYDNPDAEWPTDFGQSGWSHSWRWAAAVGYEFPDEIPGTNNHNNIYKTTITITFPDGHTTKYKISRVGHGQWLVPPGDPVWGPPYSTAEIQSGWPYGGIGVHDHICNMATDGSEFWLCRADGGSVHFEDGPENYRATEVFDPHGLKTTLTYNGSGLLEQVTQDGGRYLFINWSFFEHTGWLITKVDSRGTGGGGSQHVTYQYRLQGGYYHVLTLVRYENDPAPGQTAFAVYTYGSCWGDETEGCAASGVPMLKRADDPRYTGAMTKIRYHYNGEGCAPILINPWAYPEWVGAQPYAIAGEQSDAGDVVSSFWLGCDNGERVEYNGLGGQRKFYFGASADTVQSGFACRGFQLGKVTDFTTAAGPIGEGTPCPPGVACRRQNFSSGNPRQIWDGRNIMTTEVSNGDASGLPSEIHHPGGSAEFYDRVNSGGSDALDTSRMHNPYTHWLFSKTDERGQTTFYRRDARRRVKRIDYPDTSFEEYTYNDFNQVLTHRLPSGAIQHYDYDGFQRLWREWNETDGVAEATIYTYDTLDRVATAQNARAAANNKPFSAAMEYNGRNLVTKVTYPATEPNSTDPFVSYEYDKYGNCTAITNERGHRSTYTYDAYRRCTSYTEPLNAPGWNGSGNVASRTWNWVYDRVAPNGVDTFPASAHTSPKWRLQIEPPFNFAGDRRATARDYDCNDRLNFEFVGIIVPSQGPWIYDEGALHRYAYDGNGQKRSYIDPKNRETTYEYDNRNRLWKSNEYPNPNTGVPRTTETLYNAAGDKTLVRFPDGKTQEWPDYGYDAFGQPHVFIDERVQTTNLDYWSWGPMKKLAQVTTYRAMDGGGGTEHQETKFYYDLMGRPQTTIFPDTSREIRMYKFGQLDTWETRRGQMKRLHYDARGREDSHTWDNGAAPGINRVWDNANRLTRISNSFAIIDYSYDDAGQVRTEGTTVAGSGGQTPAGSGVLKQLNYCRYPSGEVARVTYPNGFVVQRDYTARGQLQTVRDGSQQELVKYTYLKDGKVDFQDYANGVRSAFGYDGRGMISSVWHKRNATGQSLSYRDYWRDERDRITAWKRSADNVLNAMEDGRGDRYGYDEEGQLTTASYRALNPETTPSQAQRADIFHYDALGNREGSNYLASRGTMNFPRRNNGLNQYEGWMPYSPIFYDDHSYTPPPGPANGVLTENGWISVSYNALNQPMGMWSPAYPGGASAQYMWFGYDPLGRCVKRWVGPDNQAPASVNPATYYYYDGWNLVQEGSTGNVADRVYVHGGRVDEIVGSWAGGAWNYHQYDARGHCTLLTDMSGGIREQYDYDAFGQPYFYNAAGAKVSTGAQWGNRFLFTGREWLKDLKVYDYRNRLYQPELGRFLQPDPIQFKAGDYNLYRYCHNDPVNNTDPFGLDVGFWESLIPVWGSGRESVEAYQSGAWVKGSLFAVLAATDVVPIKAGVTALTKAGAKTLIARETVTVIGKYPSYLRVAEELSAKRFNIKPSIWNKMSSTEQWAANEKFLDRAIARGGDIIFDKPVRDIGTVSGTLRKEIDYLNAHGFRLSEDGSRMIRHDK